MAAKVSAYKQARSRLAAKSVALAPAASNAVQSVAQLGSVDKSYRDAGLPTLLETAASTANTWATAPSRPVELQQASPAAPAGGYYYPYAPPAYAPPATPQQALEGVPLADVQAVRAPAPTHAPHLRVPPLMLRMPSPPLTPFPVFRLRRSRG